MFNNISDITIGTVANTDVKWNLKNSTNGHVALIGAPGTGKSVLAQRIVVELAKEGVTTLVIDRHRTLSESEIFPPLREEFKKYRKDIYAEEGIPVNLFTPLVFEDGSIEREEATEGAVCDMIFRSIKIPIDYRSTLFDAVKKVYKEKMYEKLGVKSIEIALKSLGTKKATNLYERMRYVFLYNPLRHGEGMIEEGKINIIHLNGMDLCSQEIVTELIASYVWRLGNAGKFVDKNFYFFIDECQNMNTGSGDPLALMISEGRKMGINLILATQMILQGTTNSVQQRLSSCGLMVYFKPLANRVHLTAKMINDSAPDEWSIVLNDLAVGEFVAKGNLLLNDNLHIAYPLRVNSYIGEREEEIRHEKEPNRRGEVIIYEEERR